MTDGEIIGKILGGETGRFETLVDRYLPLVRGLCAGRVANASTRDDLVQEAFIQAYLQLHRLRDRDRFAPWLTRIAINRCREWLRRQGRSERAAERLAAEAPPEPPDPADEAERREMHEWIRRQIARLPEKTRDAMMLCYVEGLSVGEAARALRVRESAVKKRLQYGRDVVGARLLERFGKAGERRDSLALRTRVLSAVPFAAAPWKGAAAATAVATGAWLAAKVAMVAPLVVAAAGAALWTQTRPATPAGPSQAQAAPETEALSAPTTRTEEEMLAAEAVPVDLTLKYAALGVTPETAPPAANVRVRLEPVTRFDMADHEAMLRAAGAWEEWQRRSAASGGIAAAGQDIPAKIEALKARLGPVEMKRRFGNAAYPLRTVELATDGAGRVGTRLRPGTYRVRLARDGDDPYGIHEGTLPQFTVSPDGRREAVLLIPDVLSVIRGTVVEANSGRPPDFARVELGGDVGTVRTGVSEAAHDGRFSFPPSETGYGAFELRVTSEKHFPAVIEGVREPGKPTELAVRLQRCGTVSGRVTDVNGKPLPDIGIFRSDITGSSARSVAQTDAAGEYELTHDGGAVRLYAAGTAVASDKVTLQLRPDESATQDFVLPLTARAVFDIRKPDGTVPEKIEGQNLDWNDSSRSGGVFKREGDRYAISYLKPGDYALAFLVEGCEGESLRFTVGPDLAEVRHSIRLRPAGIGARVRVVDSQGRPKAGANVGAMKWSVVDADETGECHSRSSSSVTFAKTDAAGEVVFRGLPPGEYTFQSGSAEVEALVPAADTLIIEVSDEPAPERPRGLFVSRDGLRPVDGLHGNLTLDAERLELIALTPSNRLTNGFLEPGENILFVGKSGYPTAIVPVTVTEEMIAERASSDRPTLDGIEVRFQQGGAIAGLVRDESGSPVPSGKVRAYPAWLEGRFDPEAEHDPRISNVPTDDMWRHLGDLFAQGARTGDDGSFRVDHLPPGRYLVCYGDTVLNPNAPLEVRAGMETGPVELPRWTAPPSNSPTK